MEVLLCSFYLIHSPDRFSQFSLYSILSGTFLSSGFIKRDLESRISVQAVDWVGYTRKTCEEMGKGSQKE